VDDGAEKVCAQCLRALVLLRGDGQVDWRRMEAEGDYDGIVGAMHAELDRKEEQAT
jgi:hypothetical protein